MIATVNHPPISLDASRVTVRLGDIRLPKLRDLPATAALGRFLDAVLGPIESGK